jgi:hypothetical protein
LWQSGIQGRGRWFDRQSNPIKLGFVNRHVSDVGVQSAGYRLVRLANGVHSLHSLAHGEKMHPGLGPDTEADLLYIRQLRIQERMRKGHGEFVVWDVGLGAAANALALLRATRKIPRELRLVSFDNTVEPLSFALQNRGALGYLHGYERLLAELLRVSRAAFQNGDSRVTWDFHIEDFPQWARRTPKQFTSPDAILFDAFSPAKNPAMWTLPLFSNLFCMLDPMRPCNMATYSRSTMFRVTLLLAGFFVGRGDASGLKEETTIAANTGELIQEPLDLRWLERARRSDSAEPLHESVYRKAILTQESWELLRAHPQFQ